MIPFAHDQPDNAHRVKKLGCGVIVFAKQLSVGKLVAAIQEIVNNEKYRESAEKYRGELLGNDFEGEVLGAVDRIFQS